MAMPTPTTTMLASEFSVNFSVPNPQPTTKTTKGVVACNTQQVHVGHTFNMQPPMIEKIRGLGCACPWKPINM
eukprot:365070-Chlamydomonas_euryale.AAC.12